MAIFEECEHQRNRQRGGIRILDGFSQRELVKHDFVFPGKRLFRHRIGKIQRQFSFLDGIAGVFGGIGREGRQIKIFQPQGHIRKSILTQRIDLSFNLKGSMPVDLALQPYIGPGQLFRRQPLNLSGESPNFGDDMGSNR